MAIHCFGNLLRMRDEPAKTIAIVKPVIDAFEHEAEKAPTGAAADSVTADSVDNTRSQRWPMKA